MPDNAWGRRAVLRTAGVIGASMVGGLIVGAETTKGMLSAPARAVTSPDDGYLPQAPSRPRSTGFTILTRFQASHGWRTSPGSRTRADLNDTTDYALGTQSLSLTTSAAGGTSGVDSPRYSSAVDLRHKTLRVLVKIDGVADLENFRLYAGDADFRNFRPYPLYLNERRTAASYVKDGAWTWVTLNGACGVAIGDGGLPVSRWRLTTSSLPGSRVRACAHDLPPRRCLDLFRRRAAVPLPECETQA